MAPGEKLSGPLLADGLATTPSAPAGAEASSSRSVCCAATSISSRSAAAGGRGGTTCALSLPVHLLVVRPQTEDLDDPLPFEDLIDQAMLDIDAA